MRFPRRQVSHASTDPDAAWWSLDVLPTVMIPWLLDISRGTKKGESRVHTTDANHDFPDDIFLVFFYFLFSFLLYPFGLKAGPVDWPQSSAATSGKNPSSGNVDLYTIAPLSMRDFTFSALAWTRQAPSEQRWGRTDRGKSRKKRKNSHSVLMVTYDALWRLCGWTICL